MRDSGKRERAVVAGGNRRSGTFYFHGSVCDGLTGFCVHDQTLNGITHGVFDLVKGRLGITVGNGEATDEYYRKQRTKVCE